MSLGGRVAGAVKRRVKSLLGSNAQAADTQIHASYFYPDTVSYADDLDTVFTASDGLEIPVYRNYRYNIKAGWMYFREFSILHALCARGVASDEDRSFLERAIGYRTLTVPVDEARQRIEVLKERFPDMFILPDREISELAVIRPGDTEIQARLKSCGNSHRSMLAELAQLDIFQAEPGHRVLEIGFISGGYSIFAFERLGFAVSGVDNCYGGQVLRAPLPEYIKKRLSSKVDFVAGDITTRTTFADNSFDLIFSASVLEHVQDLPAAFTELRRLLAPGGVMVHSYHPFYCVDGGHALGILDSPWAHVRLSRDDYLRYVTELRPHECAVTREWITGALNPTPMHLMQQHATSSGLNIRYWRAGFGKQRKGLPEKGIISEALQKHPGITLHDLTCNNVYFAATAG